MDPPELLEVRGTPEFIKGTYHCLTRSGVRIVQQRHNRIMSNCNFSCRSCMAGGSDDVAGGVAESLNNHFGRVLNETMLAERLDCRAADLPIRVGCQIN